MSHVLDKLNKHRTKTTSRRKREETVAINAEIGRETQLEDLALPPPNHAEMVWCEFNTNEETGVKPKWHKRMLPDYRPGPVKIYTKAEIKEYEDGIDV